MPATGADAREADLLSDCEAIVGTIGKRLGELHAVFSRETSDPAFAPEVADASDAANWARRAEERIQTAFETISRMQTWERDQDRDRAQTLLKQSKGVAPDIRNLAESGAGTLMTRIHGDFHLGQVLVAGGDACIIDFEGEPGASIAERRAKTSPLRDVAGLLRSFDYAVAVASSRAEGAAHTSPGQAKVLDRFVDDASAAFLAAYRVGHAQSARQWVSEANEPALLDLFLLEKAAYEICYESANRPPWLGIPVRGLARIAARIIAFGEAVQDG